MARRLIVDTGVLVTSERDNRALIEAIHADDDLAIAAVTVAELRTGVELATDAHRTGRVEFLAQVLDTFPVEPYGLTTAQAHGRLLAHVHRSGTKRGAHDLIIAATAASTGRTVLTADRNARFGDLPGVQCLTVEG